MNVNSRNEPTDVLERLCDILGAIPKKDHQNEKMFARQSVGRDLPNFSGSPEEWLLFIGNFNGTTELCGFSDEENLLRLQKALKGDAKEACQALMISPKNVKRIIETLELRFGRPEYLIRDSIEKAKNIKSPTFEDPESIIKYSVSVQNLVVILQSLNRQEYLRNPELLRTLEEKMPSVMKFMWSDYISNLEKPSFEISLEDFGNWISRKANAMSRNISYGKTEISDVRKEKTFTVVTNSSKEIRKQEINCSICKQNHLIQNCKTFLDKEVTKRYELVKEKRLCFACLSSEHSILRCRSKKLCNTNGCKKRHHPLLHLESNTVEVVSHISNSKKTLLRIMPVRVKGLAGEKTTFALLDPASTATLVHTSLAEELGIDGEREPLCLQWANGEQISEGNSKRVSLEISGINEGKSFNLKNLRTVSELPLLTQTIDKEKLASQWSYLKEINFESYENGRPTMIIGEDNALLMVTRKVIHGGWNCPVATKNWLGWVVSGGFENKKKNENEETDFTFHICDVESEEINKMVKDSFSIEDFGVKIIDEKSRTLEDKKAEEIMDSTSNRIGKRWEIGLLWRKDSIQLPESKSNALRRLVCTEKKIDKDEILAKSYTEKMEDYIERGFLRKLSKKEAETVNPKIWYLPHFAVTNPNKPGKIRIVLDAAAKSRGFGLNDFLLTGPDYLNPLPVVLWKFRMKKIAFTGDIKEMFHQVIITKEDRASQRILWRGMDRKKDPDTYEMKVMVFGASCSPSLAAFIKNKNAKEFQEEYPEAVNAIIKKHYVDDYLDSANSEEDAIKLIKEVIYIHKQGGFEIRNWNCTSKEVIESIPSHLLSDNSKNINLDKNSLTERVLGVWWNSESDTFTFQVKFSRVSEDIVNGQKIPTKREVLKFLMSIFDPLGFITHFTVKAKILLQSIWRSGISWDDKISEELNEKWLGWISELQNITDVKIRDVTLQLLVIWNYTNFVMQVKKLMQVLHI